MAEKKVNTRIKMKCDTAENWGKASNFTPLDRELLLVKDKGNFFVGDGETTAKEMADNGNFYLPTNRGEGENAVVGNDLLGNQAISTHSTALGNSTVAGGKGFRIITSEGTAGGTGTYMLDGYENYLPSNNLLPLPDKTEETLTCTDQDNGDGYSTYTLNNDGSLHFNWSTPLGLTHRIKFNNVQLDTNKNYTLSINEAGSPIGDKRLLVNGNYYYGSFTSENSLVLDTSETIDSIEVEVCLFGLSDGDSNLYIWINEGEAKEYDKYSAGDPNAYEVGDQYSLRVSNMYDRQGYITGINGNVITVDNFVAEALAELSEGETDLGDKNTFKVEAKPHIGNIDIGKNSFAIGVETQASGYNSFAEGSKSIAFGKYSHAEGNTTEAGYSAHSEGRSTHATGHHSHAEGYQTTASNNGSHAEGAYTQASGSRSHAEGQDSVASGAKSHAEGHKAISKGEGSHAEGMFTYASGKAAHVEGLGATDSNGNVLTTFGAQGVCSHAEGQKTLTTGTASHAEGDGAVAYGRASHAEGINTVTGNSSDTTKGEAAHAEGKGSIASGLASHAEGLGTHATGNYSHAEGEQTNAEAYNAHVEGYHGKATGNASHTEGYQYNSDSKITYGAETTGAHAEGVYTIAKGGFGAHAEGQYTQATAEAAHAEGRDTKATAAHSHAEGSYTEATKQAAHAEGIRTKAQGMGAHAEGSSILDTDGKTIKTQTTASGNYAHAEGHGTVASGQASHTEGTKTVAAGLSSHAEGHETAAYNQGSHAEGITTFAGSASDPAIVAAHAEGQSSVAIGKYSHAEGLATRASGQASHTEGTQTLASGSHSHAEGYCSVNNTTESLKTKTFGATGDASHAEGHNPTASGYASHAEGRETISSGQAAHAEGSYTIASGTSSHAEGTSSNASGEGAHAEGGRTEEAVTIRGTSYPRDNRGATGTYSHSEGQDTIASAEASHAEGKWTVAKNIYAHSEGNKTAASGEASHAEGSGTEATNKGAHSEGINTKANGQAAHAEGFQNNATATAAHAEGYQNTASAQAAHAEGTGTFATNGNQHVQGKYNYVERNADGSIKTAGNYAHIVGGGEKDTNRWNIHTLDWDGKAWYKDSVYVGGSSATQDSKKLITVDEATAAAEDVVKNKKLITAQEAKSEAEAVIADQKSEIIDEATAALKNTLTGILDDELSNTTTISTISGELANKVNSNDLARVATSGSYNDLDDKPTSMVNPEGLEIQCNGETVVLYDGGTSEIINIQGNAVTRDENGNIVINSSSESNEEVLKTVYLDAPIAFIHASEVENKLNLIKGTGDTEGVPATVTFERNLGDLGRSGYMCRQTNDYGVVLGHHMYSSILTYDKNPGIDISDSKKVGVWLYWCGSGNPVVRVEFTSDRDQPWDVGSTLPRINFKIALLPGWNYYKLDFAHSNADETNPPLQGYIGWNHNSDRSGFRFYRLRVYGISEDDTDATVLHNKLAVGNIAPITHADITPEQLEKLLKLIEWQSFNQ